MERVSLRACAALGLAIVFAAPLWATEPPPPAPTATPAARNLAKTRPGSFLKKEKLWDEPADLRGEAERRRDRELLTHYRRMAELDVVAKVAEGQGDLTLQERVEDVRRKELERHHKVMMRLRRDVGSALAAGTP